MLSPHEINPKRVIQIVSGSRSGSSLLKSLLANSPDVASLAGEEEPYFAMSGNGYGLSSQHDGFSTMRNAKLFRRLLMTELETSSPWEWRLSLQYKGQRLANLLNDCQVIDTFNPIPWLRQQGIWGHYDQCDKGERIQFNEMAYEMPPFVMPRPASRSTNLNGCTLLLKSPYNVYRKGVLESVFPNAEFSYVILKRNPAATINGLIDGWLSPHGFHKHLTPYGWWKFDMPTDWESYVGATTAERAWRQWDASYTNIVNWWNGLTVRFEDLLHDPETCLRSVCTYLQIETPTLNGGIPLVMHTDNPVPFRWKSRASQILPLLSRSTELISQLSYRDQSKWA